MYNAKELGLAQRYLDIDIEIQDIQKQMSALKAQLEESSRVHSLIAEELLELPWENQPLALYVEQHRKMLLLQSLDGQPSIKIIDVVTTNDCYEVPVFPVQQNESP